MADKEETKKINIELTEKEMWDLHYLVFDGMRKRENELLMDKETSIVDIKKHINFLELCSKILAKTQWYEVEGAAGHIFETNKDLFKGLLNRMIKNQGKKIVYDIRPRYYVKDKLDLEIEQLEKELKALPDKKIKAKTKEKD